MCNNQPKFTTLAELFKQVILQSGDNLEEAITNVPSELLHEKFETSHGSDLKNTEYADAQYWTNSYVYISIVFDGQVEIISALRNPPQ